MTLDYIWRGALGGLLGSALKAGILLVMYEVAGVAHIGYASPSEIIALSLLLGIPGPVLVGSSIGVLIRVVSVRRGSGTILAYRAMIGFGFVIAVGALLWAWNALFPGSNRWSLGSPLLWSTISVAFPDAGLLVGGLAGICVGEQLGRRKEGLTAPVETDEVTLSDVAENAPSS